MDIAGVGRLIQLGIDTARFRLFIKPVEHGYREQTKPGGGKKRIKRPSGSFVVGFAGGRLFAQNGAGLANEINNVIQEELDSLFIPKIQECSDSISAEGSAEELMCLKDLWSQFNEAKGLAVRSQRTDSDESSSECLCPASNTVVRFDEKVWGDQAEATALQFFNAVNDVLKMESMDSMRTITRQIKEQVRK